MKVKKLSYTFKDSRKQKVSSIIVLMSFYAHDDMLSLDG